MFDVLQTCPYWGAGGGMGGWGMGGSGMWGGSGMGGVGLLGPLLWLLVVAAIVAGGAYLVTRARADEAGPERATELLRERYARGEIDEAEFDERAARLAVE